ncbi:MAG TPA: tetratricopeptide repeat protein [Pyrinomonadaceae bacterium]
MRQNFKRRGFALIFLLTAFGFHTASAQTPLERHEAVRAAMERGDYAAAINQLQTWRLADPNLFALNNYDYLLARLSERSGDRASAAVNYQRVVARNALLSQYALWHLAQFARMTGNLTLEREQLRMLLVNAPESLLRDAASARLAESLFESGDYPAAIYELKQRSQSKVGQTAREAQALLGRAYLLANQPEQARETFNTLITQLPDATRPDDFALAAARGLDALDSGGEEAAEKSAPQLAETEHLRRAQIYHFNRDFAHARLHYAAIVERYPQSANVADALYQIGRTFYQDGKYEDALASLQRVLDKFPESKSAQDALGFAASSLSRLKRTDEAVAGYRRFVERYPNAENPERSYLNIIDALRDGGRDDDALNWIEQTRNRFKGQLPGALALFARARIYLARGDWPHALADLEALRAEADLGGMRVPEGTTTAEVSFMRAYVLEQMGRTDEAVKAYLEIPDGRNDYYGGRATERLRALALNEKTRGLITPRLESLRQEAQQALAVAQAEKARIAAQSALRLTEDQSITRELLDIARRAYAALPAYSTLPTSKLMTVGRQNVLTDETTQTASASPTKALADELLFLGLYDEGAPALAAAQNFSDESKAVADDSSKATTAARAANLSRDEAYTLAVLFKRGELAEHAVRYAEPLWKNVPRDYLIELAPREMAELLYPAPFAKTINEYAQPRGVDSRFILSIMRQESRFRADAKSVSAARGLMQFIPATANTIASQLGKQSFRQDDLYNPRAAILFGSQYLGNLFKLFPNMPQAVAASYNGGEDNVARWVARARSNDPDRYVPEIGFAQSKDYVYKIMSNLRVYRQLYNEQLQNR